MRSQGMAVSKKRGREGDLGSGFSTSLSSSSPLDSIHDENAACKWSAEVLGAISVHLALLQKHYNRQHGWGSDDCVSDVVNGLSDVDDDDGDVDDKTVKNILDGQSDDDVDDKPVEKAGKVEDGITSKELAELIDCQGPALPEGWEQHLDIRTGQVFYIHWRSCKKSYADPRKAEHVANEKISKLVHHVRKRLYGGLDSDMLKEDSSPLECITQCSAGMSSDTDEEVQSMPTFICDSDSEEGHIHKNPQSHF